jgi:glycosyltransferase involved in cell wall biosynthesis
MQKIVLFTEKFPFGQSETFLAHEYYHLIQNFDKIVIVPNIRDDGLPQVKLSSNTEVYCLDQPKIRLRVSVIKNFWIIVNIFAYEIIHSKHRFKYFTQFKWNLNRLIGLINKSSTLPTSWKNKDTILYSYWFNENATMLSILKSKKWPNKIITRAHGYDFDEGQQTRGYHPFRFFEIKMFDTIYQVSNYGVDYMYNKGHVFGNNVKLSYLGIDRQENISPINDSDRFVIVSCSHFYPVKRVQLIPEILQYVTGVDFVWLHFGDSIYKELAMDRAKSLLNKDNYKFMGWFSNKDLMSFYRSNPIDLFINVSELEGLPISIMEASSFGIPVAAPRICGIPEIISNDTGFLFDVNFNPKKLAKDLTLFMQNISRNEMYRNNIKFRFEEKYVSPKVYPLFINSINNK